MHYSASFEPLLLKRGTADALEGVKVAAALGRVPDNEKTWPAHVFSELCRELPYLSQYDVEIVIDRMDPEAGAALGYAQVQNRTQSRPQEAAAAVGNVIRIPLIIKDRRLQKFHIFEAGGQTYPMGEARIQQALLNPLVFDTDATHAPASPSLLDQIYPPGQQRTGFGRVTDANAMGLTKLNGAPSSVKAADAPIEAYHRYYQVRDAARGVQEAAIRGGASAEEAQKGFAQHLAANGYPTDAKGKVRLSPSSPSAAMPSKSTARTEPLAPRAPVPTTGTVPSSPPSAQSTWAAPHPALDPHDPFRPSGPNAPMKGVNVPGTPGYNPRHASIAPPSAAGSTQALTRATEVVRHPVPAAPAAAAASHAAAPAGAALVHAAPASAAGGLARHLTGRNALLAAGATAAVGGGVLAARHFMNRGRPGTAAPAQKVAEHVPVPDPNAVSASLQPVLSALLALHQLYYFAHWTSQGEASYSDHQLFTRLYESTQEDFDSVAERIVGHGGSAAMDPAAIFSQASTQSAQWISSGESVVAAALAGEQEVQATLMNAYGQLDQSGGLSLGIDDLLMAIASKHETNQYLLKQRDPAGGAAPAPMVEEAPMQEQTAPVQEEVLPPEAQAAAPAPAQAVPPPKTASLRTFFSRTRP